MKTQFLIQNIFCGGYYNGFRKEFKGILFARKYLDYTDAEDDIRKIFYNHPDDEFQLQIIKIFVN